jgi:DNA mismatch repair protein MutL
VKEVIVERIRRAIDGGRAQWNATFRVTTPERGLPEAEEEVIVERVAPGVPQVAVPESTPPLIPIHEQVTLRQDWAALPIQPAPQPATPPVPSAAPRPSDDFRILGVLGRLYILMENKDGLVLVDQHAAHERILFEELRRRMETQGVPAQRLLMPVTMQLSPRDCDWIAQNLDTLQKMGIGIDSFGPGTWKIDALPQFLKGNDPAPLFREIIDELRETSASSSRMRLGEDVIATTVCRHAVKARDVLREPEMVRLIQDLLRCELPYCCPHGRPTMIQISYGELEKKFGRKA